MDGLPFNGEAFLHDGMSKRRLHEVSSAIAEQIIRRMELAAGAK